MRFLTIIIFTISFILLTLSSNTGEKFKIERDHLREEILQRVQQRLKDSEKTKLLIAYTYGGSRGLSKKIKQAHRDLGLLHLFTPSGVHLSALLIPVTFVIKKMVKRELWQKGVLILIGLLPLLMDGFFSLKRMGVWRSLSHFKPLGHTSSFFITYIGDLIIGSYSVSPLSFIYSFLFFGLLLSIRNEAKIMVPITLLLGQAMVSFFSHYPISILGLLIGMILTMLFTFIFPFLLLTTIFPVLSIVTGLLLTIFSLIVTTAHNAIINIPFYQPTTMTLLLIPIIYLPLKCLKRKIAIGLLLLFHCEGIYDLSWKEYHLSETHFSKDAILPPASLVYKRVIKNKSIWLYFNDDGKGRCTLRLFDGFYEKRCRYLLVKGHRSGDHLL